MRSPSARFRPPLLPALLTALWLFLLLSASAAAQERTLSLPVDCSDADLCFVQNYVDQQPGPGWADYMCRHLSYDDHEGTDIRVSFADMLRGVPVLAAADGVVVALRDGMPDMSVEEFGVERLGGRLAGNGVLIDHNGGLTTQYSHLRQGSVLVEIGDVVRRGEPIGLVGLSGNTVFPHVEFSVSLAGRKVDPFVGDGDQGCGGQREPMWDEAALAALPYRARGGLGAGLTNVEPDLRRVLLSETQPLHAQGRRLYFWAAVFGAGQGDTMHLRLTGPGGQLLAETELEVEGDKAQKLVWVGKRMSPGDWRSGSYRGECELIPAGGGEPVRVATQVFRHSTR